MQEREFPQIKMKLESLRELQASEAVISVSIRILIRLAQKCKRDIGARDGHNARAPYVQMKGLRLGWAEAVSR